MIVKPPSGMITVSFLGALSSLRVILPERNQDDLGHFWKLRFVNEDRTETLIKIYISFILNLANFCKRITKEYIIMYILPIEISVSYMGEVKIVYMLTADDDFIYINMQNLSYQVGTLICRTVVNQRSD